MEKFPDHIDSPQMGNGGSSTSPVNGFANGGPPRSDRWHPAPRRENGHPTGLGITWANSRGGRGHGRQKSLSDAFKTIRSRNGSFSQNAHEIADALRAPLSPKLIVRQPTSSFTALYTLYRKRGDAMLIGDTDTLSHVVHVVGSYEYVVQIDPKRL